MSEGIEVLCETSHGSLWLSCPEQVFVRLRDTIISEPTISGLVGESRDAIQHIEISLAPAERPATRVRDRIALVACGTITFVLLFVFAAGVMAIIGWLR